jgi:hypothetical protein
MGFRPYRHCFSTFIKREDKEKQVGGRDKENLSAIVRRQEKHVSKKTEKCFQKVSSRIIKDQVFIIQTDKDQEKMILNFFILVQFINNIE